MKHLTTVAVYGLVPVPLMPDAQACDSHDNQPLTADVNASNFTGIEIREIAGRAPIIIGLSILSVGAAVALAFAI